MSFLAVTNGLIVSGRPGARERPGHVLVKDNLIHGIYDSPAEIEQIVGSSPVTTVDATGLSVAPGMMDLHVHLFLSGEKDAASNWNFDPGLAAERAKQHLQAGVTTVRDVAAPIPAVLELRDAIAAKEIAGARIVASGPIITTPGGHGAWIGAETEPGPALVETVRSLAAQGVDCIKLSVSGKLATAQFGEDDVRAAVETAHKLGLHVAAHAVNAESVRVSAAAGADSIEHGTVLDDEAIEALIRSKSVLVPTMAVADRVMEYLADPTVPADERERWLNSPNGVDGGDASIFDVHMSSIKAAIAAGVPTALGTDAGGTFARHGLAALEAQLLVDSGLSHRQALAAATYDAAVLMGIDDQLGSLETGKIADIILVDGNPLEEISSLAKVRVVIKDGEIVHRAGD